MLENVGVSKYIKELSDKLKDERIMSAKDRQVALSDIAKSAEQEMCIRDRSVSNADVNTTFKIINHRYNEQLPTIVSSELSINEISAIDEALGSRIAEMTRTHKMYISKDKNKNQRFCYG